MTNPDDGAAVKKALRSVVALSGSALLVQAVSVFSVPILSRIYAVEHFGVLAAFNALVAPATLLVGLQLAPAIVVLPNDEDVEPLLVATLGAAAVGSLLVIGVGMFAAHALQTFLGLPPSAGRLMAGLAAISVFLNVLGAVASAITNRQQKYNILATSRLAAAISSAAVNISVGLANPSWGGLLCGYLAGSAVRGAICVVAIRTVVSRALRHATWRGATSAIWRYRRFPFYVLPSDVINTLFQSAPVYALTAFATVTAIGSYGLAQSMLILPMSLLSSSIGEVFSRDAAKRYATSAECRRLFERSTVALGVLSVILFSVIALVGPQIFALIFGEKWRTAGEYVRIIAPLMALRFVASPLSAMYIIAGRQREDLLLQICAGIVMTVSVFTAGALHLAPTRIIGACVAVSVTFYATLLLRSWRFAIGGTKGGGAQIQSR